jgi:hypothetical protein
MYGLRATAGAWNESNGFLRWNKRKLESRVLGFLFWRISILMLCSRLPLSWSMK